MNVGYWAWFLTIGTEGWDHSNIINGDEWNLNRFGLRSELPSSISPGFWKMKLFLLELGSPRFGSGKFRLGSTVCGDWLRAGTEEWDCSCQTA